MRVFDLSLVDAKCPDGKSKSLPELPDHLDRNGQLFEL